MSIEQQQRPTGNVFEWILSESDRLRQARAVERKKANVVRNDPMHRMIGRTGKIDAESGNRLHRMATRYKRKSINAT